MVIEPASKATAVPLPDGDFEVRRGAFTARGPSASEAEEALNELLRVRWEDNHLDDQTPIIDEDHIVPAIADER